MSKVPRLALRCRQPVAGRSHWIPGVLCVSLLLAACVAPERRPAERRPEPPRPAPGTPPSTTFPPGPGPVLGPGPGPAPSRNICPPGVRPIGVLAILNDVVFRNGRAAINGERVCDGDLITTGPSGVGEVLPDGDRESDSVHLAEGTDPRFTWTLGGCLSVDGYRNGRIIATARRHCMVVRTPDTLMLLAAGRVQFQVTRNASTQVVPLRGSLTKLQPLSDREVYAFSQAQFLQRAAPVATQPQMHSLNVYTNFNSVRPAVRLPPSEIQRIDSSVLRRAIVVPPPAPVIR